MATVTDITPAGPPPLTSTEAKTATDKIRTQFTKALSEVGELGIMLDNFNMGKGWVAMGYDSLKAWQKTCLPEFPYQTVQENLSRAQVNRQIGSRLTKRQAAAMRRVAENDRASLFDRVIARCERDDDGEPMIDDKILADEISKYRKKKKRKAKAEADPEIRTPNGEIVAGMLAEVFVDLDPIKQLLTDLSQFKTDIEEIANTPAGALVATWLVEIEQRRLHLYDGVASAVPHAICPYCAGDKADCRVCSGSGWVNKSASSQRKAQVK